MADKQIIRAEIEKMYNLALNRAKIDDADYWNAKADAYRNALLAIDSTPEEPASEDLEEAFCNYVEPLDNHPAYQEEELYMFDSFKAGSQWQKQHMLKEAISAEVKVVEHFMGTTTFRCMTDMYKKGDKVKLIIVKED